MAVASEESPTMISDDDIMPPTPSDASDDDGLTAAEVLDKLEKAWCNEQLAPELLDYKTYIVECVMEQVKEMEENLLHVRNDSFVAGIHKLELERIKYVLCSYLRTRLKKIEVNIIFVLEEEAGRGVDAATKLSPEELVYAREYADLMEDHMGTLALRHMPSSFQKLDHNKAVTKPLMDSFVFARAVENVDNIMIDEEGTQLNMNPGTQIIAHYRPLSALVQSESLQLI